MQKWDRLKKMLNFNFVVKYKINKNKIKNLELLRIFVKFNSEKKCSNLIQIVSSRIIFPEKLFLLHCLFGEDSSKSQYIISR